PRGAHRGRRADSPAAAGHQHQTVRCHERFSVLYDCPTILGGWVNEVQTYRARFADRVAIVTGAGSGLGAASATRLAAEGAQVLAVDVNADAARRTAETIGAKAHWARADVSDEAAVDEYMRVALEHFGRVDHFHLNAGVPGSLTPFPDLDMAE